MIGVEQAQPLPMEGSLPPDLQGTFFRVGPASSTPDRGPQDLGAGPIDDGEGNGEGNGDQVAVARRGALHAVELRDGKAVSYLRRASEADAGVFWHAGSVLALPEAGLPAQYSRLLEPETFAGALTVPIASHVHRLASDGTRVLFAVDEGAGGQGRRARGERLDQHHPQVDGEGQLNKAQVEGESQARASEVEGIFLRIGEWDYSGALSATLSVELERATWQHDIGVTTDHVVFIESPTTPLTAPGDNPVPFGWVPGAEGWVGVVPRGGGGTGVRWFRLDPCLVTHVLGAYEDPGGPDDDDAIVVAVCRYAVPEVGQPVDLSASVVGRAGVGLTTIGGSLGVLERWRIVGENIERGVVDERCVEYPRIDALCEGTAFRYGYCVEMARRDATRGVSAGRATGGPDGRDGDASPIGLLQFDFARDSVAAWTPGDGRTPSEPVFVRADGGHADDEGWLLTIVDNPDRGASDLYVLDASSMARRGPEAIIHLPERLPPRSHGEWVPADRYR